MSSSFDLKTTLHFWGLLAAAARKLNFRPGFQSHRESRKCHKRQFLLTSSFAGKTAMFQSCYSCRVSSFINRMMKPVYILGKKISNFFQTPYYYRYCVKLYKCKHFTSCDPHYKQVFLLRIIFHLSSQTFYAYPCLLLPTYHKEETGVEIPLSQPKLYNQLHEAHMLIFTDIGSWHNRQ